MAHGAQPHAGGQRIARALGRLFAPSVSGTLTTVVTGLDRAKTTLLPESATALHADLGRAMDADHKAFVRLHRGAAQS